MKRKMFILKLILLAFLFVGCNQEKDTKVRAVDSNSEEIGGGGTDGGGLDSGGFDGGLDSGGTDSGGTDSGGTDSGGTDGGTDGGSTEFVDYTETFNQINLSGDDVTILFSIDNSESMLDEQTELVNSLSSFNDTLVQSNMNFRILVTSTNLMHKGELTHNVNDLTRAAYEANPSQFESDIDEAMFIGACNKTQGARFCDTGIYDGVNVGYNDESTLINNHAILEKYSQGADKVIGDTEKVIIVNISDEGDYGFFLYGINETYNMNTIINGFYNLIEPGRIHFYSIYNYGCFNKACDENEVIGNMDNGTIADINQPFNNVLAQISNQAVSLQKVFVLNKVPSTYESLEVKVNHNGNELILSSNQYSFNGSSITLTDQSTLISGSTITVIFKKAPKVEVTSGGLGPNDKPIE